MTEEAGADEGIGVTDGEGTPEPAKPDWPLSNDALVRLINGSRSETTAFRTLFLSVQALALAAPALMKDINVASSYKILIIMLWFAGMVLLVIGLIKITPRDDIEKLWRKRNQPNGGNSKREVTELDVGKILLSAAITQDHVCCRESLKFALNLQQSITYRVVRSRIIYMWGAGLVVLSLVMLVFAREFFAMPEVGPVPVNPCIVQEVAK